MLPAGISTSVTTAAMSGRAEHAQGFVGVRGFDDLEAGVVEHVDQQDADQNLVLDDQDRWLA